MAIELKVEKTATGAVKLTENGFEEYYPNLYYIGIGNNIYLLNGVNAAVETDRYSPDEWEINGVSGFTTVEQIIDALESVGITLESRITNPIVEAIQTGQIPDAGDPSVDPFGAKRVSQSKSLIDLKQVGNNAPLFFDRVSIGGGTSVYNVDTSSSLMSVTSNLDAQITQTFQHLHYQSGKGQKLEATFTKMHNESGVLKRVGYYTSVETTPFDTGLDGIYFEADGTTLSMNISNNGVVNKVNQVDWNLDKMDGTGVSGIILDAEKRQIFVLDLQWLAVGKVRVGFSINKGVNYVHEFRHANNGTEGAYMRSPHKPVRYEIRSTGGAGSLEQICATVESESGQQLTGIVRSVSTAKDLQCTTTNQYAIYGIRLKDDFYSEINLLDLTLLNENNDNFIWRVILNPTITGTFTFVDVPDSAVQVAVSSVGSPATCSGGIEISSGVQQANLIASKEIDNAIKLGTSIAGVKDVIVVAYEGLTTGSDVFGTLSWREFL